MQLYTAVLALLSATLASSSAIVGSQQTTLDGSLKVPGQNPLMYCADPSDYLGHIDFVDLTPNPPIPGQTLTIVANGTLDQDVGEGTKVFIQVKYGLITLIKQEADLCENLPKIDLECPLKKGPIAISKQADIPRQVPPGNYQVMANVYTDDGEIVTCMTASVAFHR